MNRLKSANRPRRNRRAAKKAKSRSPRKTKTDAPKPGKTGQKAAKASKSAPKKEDKRTDGRDGSKKAIILTLLRRKEGATIAEIAKATDWQNHSIRGFISGTITKKMRLAVESAKNETGEHVYQIAN